jgi:hypothetical protein
MTTSVLAGSRLVWMMNKANWRLVTEQASRLQYSIIASQRADQYFRSCSTGATCRNDVGICYSSVAARESRDHITGGLLMGMALQDETISIVDER